jgi:hypothetical protein
METFYRANVRAGGAAFSATHEKKSAADNSRASMSKKFA